MDFEHNAVDTDKYSTITGLEKTGQMTSGTDLRLEVAALSDVGLKRQNNEDSFGYDLSAQIFVVCDGMGGMAAGEVASNTATERTLQLYRELGSKTMEPEQRLHAAIAGANEAVWQLAHDNRQLRGMGTTLVAACVVGSHIVIGNIGDSRAYFLRDGGCVQITEDHSFAAEQMRRGVNVTHESSATPLAQFITRAVGVNSMVDPDLFIAELAPGDTILLATDGLTRYADTEKIAGHIQAFESLDAICRSLVDIAHRNGAEDNVTCLLLRVH
jgi:protein phosphatase